jgi:hypothetical protein
MATRAHVLEIQADIDEDFVKSALKKTSTLIRIIPGTKFYIIDHPNYCPIFSEDLPKSIRKEYTKLCRQEITSMSITWGKHDHILVHITPEEEYLRTNKKALIGTLLHEIIHANLGHKLDRAIYKDMHAAFDKFKKQLHDLKYTDKQINKLYSSVSRSAAFVLLDLYGNSELIKKRLINYLVEDYSNLYKCKKRCVKPDLPSKKKKLDYAKEAFDYELSLLSVIVPFMRSSSPKAKKLIKHLTKNFESNVPELAKKLEPLKKYAARNISNSSAFRKKYFTMIYEATLDLIK